jgi:hypothetical protein
MEYSPLGYFLNSSWGNDAAEQSFLQARQKTSARR